LHWLSRFWFRTLGFHGSVTMMKTAAYNARTTHADRRSPQYARFNT
jgi:hypothetical protein